MSNILKFLFLIFLTFGIAKADPEEEKFFEQRMRLQDKAITGDLEAVFQLGSFYALHNNDQLAEDWFKKAGKKGHRKSLWKLTHLAQKVDGKNDYILLEWTYLKLRSLGSTESVIELARIYSDSNSPLFNKNKALLFFEEAIVTKNPKAYLEFGLLHMGTKGFKINLNRAMRLFRKSAEYNNIKAMQMLGQCFLYGLGVKKDSKLAWHWYGKAAQLGDTESMFTIANALYIGKDIEKNIKNAQNYYKRAANKGHLGAKEKLAILNFKK